MSELLLHPSAPRPDGTFASVTPESAGWSYVGFEVLRLAPGVSATRDTGAREACIVVIAGRVSINSRHGDWPAVGRRGDPFSGLPESAYVPPGTEFTLTGEPEGAEIGLCLAPAREGTEARLLPGAAITPEARGSGACRRTVHPILMGDGEAESLLVCEVQTPGGNWSSYPPHKHDRDALPEESYLEETYYHRIEPRQGFVVQRVYTDDRSLDETLTAGDGDVVLVPRGYHPVGVPAGYRSYYLNVMAGPTRTWSFHNDPDHEWLLS